MIITGIGSRNTPKDICNIFTEIGKEIKNRNWWCRSGGARGADYAFEKGAEKNCIVYLPSNNYNYSRGACGIERCPGFNNDAFNIVLQHEPYAEKLSTFIKCLKVRNVYQILGESLNNRSDAVICWTPNGDIIGGTGLALKIARQFGTPIFNFGSYLYSIDRIFTILERQQYQNE